MNERTNERRTGSGEKGTKVGIRWGGYTFQNIPTLLKATGPGPAQNHLRPLPTIPCKPSLRLGAEAPGGCSSRKEGQVPPVKPVAGGWNWRVREGKSPPQRRRGQLDRRGERHTVRGALCGGRERMTGEPAGRAVLHDLGRARMGTSHNHKVYARNTPSRDPHASPRQHIQPQCSQQNKTEF